MKSIFAFFRAFWKPIVAILGAIALCWLLLALAGYDAGAAFKALYNASFKNNRAMGSWLNKACPLLFTGIAVAISFRCNVFNIGTEGQFLLGAIAATVVGTTLTGLPGIVVILLMFLAGMLAGALWGFIPGWLKARYGVSEVITTIMFNYIAVQLVGYLIRGPLQDATQAEPQSFSIAKDAYLTYLLPETRMHIGFFLGLVVAVLAFIWLFRTYHGYEMRAVGLGSLAAQCGGINVERTMISAMLISGGIAGLGGAIELAGTSHFMFEGISPGYGYTAIAVSILASNNPIGVVLSSLLFGFLNAGSTAMQRAADVSASFVNIFQGVIVVFVALAEISRQRGKRLLVKGGK